MIMVWIGVYLLLGILFLAILDLTTHRVRKQLGNASRETQFRLIYNGSFVKPSMATVLTLLALWVLWPVALFGYIESLMKKKGAGVEKKV